MEDDLAGKPPEEQGVSATLSGGGEEPKPQESADSSEQFGGKGETPVVAGAEESPTPFEAAMIELQKTQPEQFEKVLAAMEAGEEKQTLPVVEKEVPSEPKASVEEKPKEDSEETEDKVSTVSAEDQRFRLQLQQRELNTNVTNAVGRINALVAKIDSMDESLKEMEELDQSDSKAYKILKAEHDEHFKAYEQWSSYHNNLLGQVSLIDAVREDITIAPALAPYQLEYIDALKAGTITADMGVEARLEVVKQARLASGKPPVHSAPAPKNNAAADNAKKALERLRKLRIPTTSQPSGGVSSGTNVDLTKFPPEMQQAMREKL